MSRRLLIGISGFGQSLARSSGVEDLLLATYWTDPDVLIVRHEWRDNFQATASFVERIYRQWAANNLPIVVVGYSYGGDSAVRLATTLEAREIPLEWLFLIDPVWRMWRYLPSLISLGGRGVLEIPANVKNLETWRQRETRIRGAEIRVRDPKRTQWGAARDHLVEHVKHTEMDEIRAINHKIRRIVSDLTNEGKTL